MTDAIQKVHNAPPGKPERYSTEEMCEALMKAKGLVTVAARQLGCHPKTVRRYIDNHPTVAEAKTEAREGILDMAEARLFQAIDKGEPWAISSILRTLGKDRGYVERVEQDQRGHVEHYIVNIGGDDSSTGTS